MDMNFPFEPFMNCTLVTTDFRLVIGLGDHAKVRDKWAEVSLELVLIGQRGSKMNAVTSSYTPVSDLVRLAAYLEGYIASVALAPESLSCADEYVFSDLALRILVSDAEQFEGDDGEVIIAIKVNVGAGASRVYIGVEAAASFHDLRRFAGELRGFARWCSGSSIL
jgi:hypothetical protein